VRLEQGRAAAGDGLRPDEGTGEHVAGAAGATEVEELRSYDSFLPSPVRQQAKKTIAGVISSFRLPFY
jgi:hypothetical protein